jgi:hypothetical protein
VADGTATAAHDHAVHIDKLNQIEKCKKKEMTWTTELFNMYVAQKEQNVSLFSNAIATLFPSPSHCFNNSLPPIPFLPFCAGA